ncbi:hypothetical protein GCM10023176_05910 [Micromonospora coerulea]|uniref:Uncharacterized protein n=1 Tax=Micromonospora coerulea TaxID=47856 RepID=A0ABP8S5V1_9ACTN
MSTVEGTTLVVYTLGSTPALAFGVEDSSLPTSFVVDDTALTLS